MSVERNKDGSITVKTKNGVTSVSKTIVSQVEYKHEEFQNWVEHCASLVTPCSHTFKETEQYFLEQCDTQPIDKYDRRIKNFQLNVIMNHFKDKLEHQAADFSFDMTDEEIEKWQEDSEAMNTEAKNSSPERFGLIIRGYCLPRTERNKVFYDQSHKETQGFNHEKAKQNQLDLQDICFLFEETTEHCQCNGGGGSLMQQLTVFRGVSEEDIKNRNTRFLGYIIALRDMGKLPGLTDI